MLVIVAGLWPNSCWGWSEGATASLALTHPSPSVLVAALPSAAVSPSRRPPGSFPDMTVLTSSAKALPPSTHPFAEVVERLEAGGSMLPDTPENLMQDHRHLQGLTPCRWIFTGAICSTSLSRCSSTPCRPSNTSPARSISIAPNSYQGDQAELRIWRGEAGAHPELLEFMEKGEIGKLPKLLHHLWHDRINMEFAEACMDAMLWHQGMGGRFNDYLDSEVYRQNADKAIKAYFKGNPLMLGLYNCFRRCCWSRSRSCPMWRTWACSGGDGAGLLRDERHLRRGRFFGCSRRDGLPGERHLRGGWPADLPPSVHPWRVLRDHSQIRRLHLALRGGTPLCGGGVLPHGTIPRHQELQRPGWPGALRAVRISLRASSMPMCFLWAQRGYRPPC